MLIWIKDAPKIHENCDDCSDVENFINRYITCNLDENSSQELCDIVSAVQTHSKKHTGTCRKGKQVGCRFGFPRPVSLRTFVCTPYEFLENDNESMKKDTAKKNLERMWPILADPELSKDITTEEVFI